MPKPPMREDIIVFQPTGEEDKHGEPDYNEIHSKARVSYTSKSVQRSDGTTFQPLLKVSLPPTTRIGYGYLIQWTDRFGEVVKDRVSDMKETTTYSGNQVYYRTVYVGEK